MEKQKDPVVSGIAENLFHVVWTVDALQRPFDGAVHGGCKQFLFLRPHIVFQKSAWSILSSIEGEEKPFSIASHAIAPIFAIVSKVDSLWLGTIFREQIDHPPIRSDINVIENRPESQTAVDAWHFDFCDFEGLHAVGVYFQQECRVVFKCHHIE